MKSSEAELKEYSERLSADLAAFTKLKEAGCRDLIKTKEMVKSVEFAGLKKLMQLKCLDKNKKLDQRLAGLPFEF